MIVIEPSEDMLALPDHTSSSTTYYQTQINDLPAIYPPHPSLLCIAHLNPLTFFQIMT